MSVLKNVNVSNLDNTAYGEAHTESMTPFVAGNGVYGFIPSNFRTFLAGTGTATMESNLFKCTSGTTVGDYGVIRSFRSLNYKTGQGALIRTSGYFSAPQAFTWSGMGGFNIGDELSFGYNGANFGIWHRYGGHAEVQDIQVTGAASGAENATVTLNSVVYSIPLTAGTVQHNAYEIAQYLNANAPELEAEQLDDTVRIDYLSDGDKTGTFSFSSPTATGTVTEVNTGVSKVSHFYPKDTGISQGIDATGVDIKESWNGDALFAGFDPTKGNSYQINYQNGFGDLKFYVEDPDTGGFINVHTIKWGNSVTVTNLTNPSLRIGCYATCVGAATPVEVYCAYTAGFVEGYIAKTRNPRGDSNTKSIGTTNTNIMTIRNSRTYNARANQVEIDPSHLTLANDGGKTAIFEIRGNANVDTGETNFQPVANNIVAQKDVSGGEVSGGRLLGSFVVAKGQSLDINLNDFEIRQPPSLRLTISGRMSSGAAADLTASMVWYEDV
jgi:hypothetical protein